MTDIVERLRKHAGGLCTENPADYSTWVSKDVIIDAIKEIEIYRTMIGDFLSAWEWYQHDPTDREGPWDEIYEMKKHMKNLGHKND
jgi:hypothetical protein